MKIKESFALAGAMFASAVFIGAFIGIVVQTYRGDGFPYIAIALACFALAWVAGKIENRNNKDSV